MVTPEHFDPAHFFAFAYVCIRLQVTDKAAFKISFGGKMVTPGCKLSINDIVNEPEVEITSCEAGGVYTLLMVDPDFPSPHHNDMK